MSEEEVFEEVAEPIADVPDQPAPLDVLTWLQGLHPAVFVFTIAVLLALPALFSWLQRLGPKGKGSRRGPKNVLLLVGPSGAGKTCLFYKVLRDEVPETLTSMKEQQEKLPSGKILVDFPGHIRLRAALDGWLDRAVALVLVVDASNPRSGPREGAEFLFELLTDARLEAGPPVLVACNKGDVVGAKAPDKIRVAMEREMEELRRTRAAKADVSSDHEGQADKLPLGRPGVKFKLEEDAPCEVTFAACSVAKGDIDEVVEFVESHVGPVS